MIDVTNYPTDETGQNPLYHAYKYAMQLQALGYEPLGLVAAAADSEDVPSQDFVNLVTEQFRQFAQHQGLAPSTVEEWVNEDSTIAKALQQAK